MSSNDYMVGFILLVAFAGTIVFGGVTGIYFLDKHRIDPPQVMLPPSPEERPDASTPDPPARDRLEDRAVVGPSATDR